MLRLLCEVRARKVHSRARFHGGKFWWEGHLSTETTGMQRVHTQTRKRCSGSDEQALPGRVMFGLGLRVTKISVADTGQHRLQVVQAEGAV